MPLDSSELRRSGASLRWRVFPGNVENEITGNSRDLLKLLDSFFYRAVIFE